MQGYRDAEMQGCRGARIQKCRDARIQRCRGAGVSYMMLLGGLSLICPPFMLNFMDQGSNHGLAEVTPLVSVKDQSPGVFSPTRVSFHTLWKTRDCV